jgi:predicted metal-dependent phosphoesterase TrpH
MSSVTPFGLPGKWFRGSLHTHTTQSDGKLSPAENMRWHAAHGYDFVGITDHNVVTDPLKFVNNPPLLALPSVEISARRGTVDYHVIGVGVSSMPIERGRDPQETIDAVNAAGGVCFIAHPYWHDHTFEDLLALREHIGIEIFNTGCWLEINKGHSLVHWDAVLRRGQYVWGFATDDSHFRYPDHGRGWIRVRAENLNPRSILNALRKGWFYSTMGPEIYDVQLTGRQVTVHCSPARTIFLIGDVWRCPPAAQAWANEPITEATFTMHQDQHYFRVEVVDMVCQSAWTNAYLVDP